MKRLLVIGEWFSSNLGDGVIGKNVEYCFKQNSDYEIVMFDMALRSDFSDNEMVIPFGSFKNYKTLFIQKVNSLIFKERLLQRGFEAYAKQYSMMLEKKVKEIKPSALIFGGGQMLMSYFLWKLEKTIDIAEKYSLPVFFNACGIGNSMNADVEKRISKLLQSRCIKYVSLRDGKKELERFVNRDLIDTFDTALFTNEVYEISEIKTMKIGIGIMFTKYYSIAKQVAFWRKMLNNLQKNGVEFEVFTNGNGLDYSFCEYLLRGLKLDTNRYLAKRPLSPEELVSIISHYNAIISMRLHSLIISYSLGVPAIAIAWDKKVRAFYAKMNIEKYCFDLESSSNLIIEQLNILKNDADYYSQKKYAIERTKDNFVKMCRLIDENLGRI